MSMAMHQGSDARRRLSAAVGVGLIHAVLIAGFALSRPDFPVEPVAPQVFDILMMRLQPAPEAANSQSGGGEPATPSRIHTPPVAQIEKVELSAPLVQAPLPTLEVGLAAVPTIEPGLGRGGQGTGTGDGSGSGNGSGSGRGSGPVLVNGPRGAVMSRDVSAAALTSLPGPYAVLHCYIRVGRDRLEDCRVKDEHPSGAGVGAAALRKAEEFRYRPPDRLGRFNGRHRQTIAVAFPAPPETLTGGDGGRH